MTKNNKIFRFIFGIVVCCLPFIGFAQPNPIYVTSALTPPYSLTLSDYVKPGAQNLVATIMVNDVSITNLPVRLHLKIETTAGVGIENIPNMTTTPIYLSGGQLTVLFGDDLSDYLNINNLQFKGYSRDEYRRTGQLPEGFYRFTVEVRHFHTGRPISNQGSVMAWIATGKPPVLKTPLEGAELGTIPGMPLTFSWQPASVGVPATGIQYTFEMWEMRIPGISPYVVAASMPVFHTETLSATTLTILPASLFLEPGMNYAWRVTAFDPSGRVPFAEKGQSELRTFVYQSKCDCVNDFVIEQRGRNAVIRWTGAANQTSFYVEVENPDTDYSTRQQLFNNRMELYNLEDGKKYNIRVQAVCNNNEDNTSDFTEWQTLAIPEPRPISEDCPECGCDAEFTESKITNFELRKDLQPGDIVVSRDGSTRYILETVEQQGDGIYKGLFLLWWEYYRVKIICNYWDLSVNTDNVIINFGFESVYDPQFLLDVDAAKDYLDDLTKTISEGLTNTEVKDSVKVDVPIDDIYVDDDGNVVVVTVDENGNEKETILDGNYNATLIQDEEGNEYVVTGNGKVMGVDEFSNTGGNKYKQDDYNKEKEANAKPSVIFGASTGQTYGFDAYAEQKSAIQNDYPELKSGYRVPFKSVASYQTDKVAISGQNKETAFRTEWGIPATVSGNELTIRGGGNGDETILYAYNKQDSTETVAGKLNILSFDKQIKKVYVVSVNSAKVSDKKNLKDELDKIYAPAVTEWLIETAGDIQVNFANGQFTHGGSSAISVYNSDQKAVIKAFKEQKTQEKEALYLFFVDNVKGRDASGDYAGYMPLGYQSGFIYSNPGAQAVAHELAHGAFNLYHTFSNENFVASQNTTDNLMDYKGGTDLWKYQWQLIHNPQNVWLKFLQDEKEGEKVIYGFSSEENKKKFDRIFNKLNEIKEFQEVFNLIEEEATYKYMVTEDLYTLNTKRSGAATSLKFNNRDVLLNPKTGIFEAISFAYMDNEKNELTYVDISDPNASNSFIERLKLPTYNGFIFLDMDRVDENVVFHEFNHAAQYIINHKGKAYDYVNMEIETRMIIFYAAFKAASQATRENRGAMWTHFLNFYGFTEMPGDFAIFFGEGLPNTIGGLPVTKDLYYACFMEHFLHRMGKLAREKDRQTVKEMMLRVAYILKEKAGYNFEEGTVTEDNIIAKQHLLDLLINK